MIQGKSIKRKIFTGFNFVILMLLVLSCIVPLWYTLCISLSGKAAVAGGMYLMAGGFYAEFLSGNY